MVKLVAEAVSENRVVGGRPASISLRDWVVLEGRLPIVPSVSAGCEVANTAQLLGQKHFGIPHLTSVI